MGTKRFAVDYELDERRLRTWEWPGSGPPLILLPGAGSGGLLFADLAEALPQRRVVVFDPPGTGASDPWASWDLGHAVDLTARVASQICDGPAIWGGHSWGGKVAAILAGRHPELVAGTVLLDPSPGSILGLDDQALDDFVDSAWDGRLGPWPDEQAAIDHLATLPHYAKWTPNVELALRNNLVAVDGVWTTRVTRPMIWSWSDATLRVDYSSDIEAIRCPTLYIVASRSTWWQELTNDAVMPAHVERVDIDGQHLIYVDNPDPVVAAIDQFLTKNRL